MRRGTRSKVSGKDQQEGYAEMKADPGMVLNYKAAEEVQPQPAAPQPDLLDFDGLSMDDAPAANAQVSQLILCPEAFCRQVMFRPELSHSQFSSLSGWNMHLLVTTCQQHHCQQLYISSPAKAHKA